jgi:dipeptidyl aminopeptidase/acylaminoacyl peptidase
MRSTHRALVAIAAAALGALAAAVPAAATFPGQNGPIAYWEIDHVVLAEYLAFVTPDGATGPSAWVRSWNEDDQIYAFSPDGLHAVGQAQGNRLALGVATAPAHRFRQITHPRQGDVDQSPSWSPDGRSLVFTRDSDTGGQIRLYTVRADGSHLRRIGHGEDPTWSSTGQIAFTRRSSIYSSTATGKHVRRLTHGRRDAAPDWSPDGQRLVYSRGGDIATVAAAGDGLRVLTHTKRVEEAPVYSPDGTQIAFATHRNLIVIPIAGGPERAYRCQEPDCFGPSWLPAATTTSAIAARQRSTSVAHADGLRVSPTVGRPGTTFSFHFTAPEASVYFEYEGFYGWTLTARRRRCANPNRWDPVYADYRARIRVTALRPRPRSGGRPGDAPDPAPARGLVHRPLRAAGRVLQ